MTAARVSLLRAAPLRVATDICLRDVQRPVSAPAQAEMPSQEQHQAVAHPVPDFAKLHASWARRLHQARIAGQRPPTAPVVGYTLTMTF